MLAGIFVGRLGDEEDEKIAIFSQLRLRDLNTNFNKIKQLENNGPCFPEKTKGWVTEECGSCLTCLPQRQRDKEGEGLSITVPGGEEGGEHRRGEEHA
jgi:hypothetical protein